MEISVQRLVRRYEEIAQARYEVACVFEVIGDAFKDAYPNGNRRVAADFSVGEYDWRLVFTAGRLLVDCLSEKVSVLKLGHRYALKYDSASGHLDVSPKLVEAVSETLDEFLARAMAARPELCEHLMLYLKAPRLRPQTRVRRRKKLK